MAGRAHEYTYDITDGEWEQILEAVEYDYTPRTGPLRGVSLSLQDIIKKLQAAKNQPVEGRCLLENTRFTLPVETINQRLLKAELPYRLVPNPAFSRGFPNRRKWCIGKKADIE